MIFDFDVSPRSTRWSCTVRVFEWPIRIFCPAPLRLSAGATASGQKGLQIHSIAVGDLDL